MGQAFDATRTSRWLAALIAVTLGIAAAAVAAPPAADIPIGAVDASGNVMPLCIRRHSASFQESWRRIQAVIERNERLAAPRPEPYLARAELLATAQDHESALKDYLVAIRLVRASSEDLAEQARYLGLLEDAVRRVVESPLPLYIADAGEQYSVGLEHFRRGINEAALVRFDGAVKLDPTDARYLYFRGLTLKRLGRDDEATRDIRRAVSLDVKTVFRASPHVSSRQLREYRATMFEWVQGPLRVWLDAHFDGVPVPSSPDLKPARAAN